MKTDLHIKIEKSLKNELQKAAEEENRTLTNLAETILLRWLEDRKRSTSAT